MKSHLGVHLTFWVLVVLFSVLTTFASQPPPAPQPRDTTFNDVRINAQTMAKGVDLASFDITSAKPHGRQMKSIFELTHKPDTQLPDQMELLGEDRFQMEEKVALIKTASEFEYFTKETNSIEVDVPIEEVSVGFFLTNSFSKEQQQMSEKSRYMAMNYGCLSKYKLTFNDSAINEHHLEHRLRRLIRDPSKYEHILQHYGTHYISVGIFGGCELSTVTIESAKFDSVIETDSNIGFGATVDLMKYGKFEIKHETEQKLKQKLEALVQTAVKKCSAVGGSHNEAGCYDKEKRDDWVGSIKESPRLIYAELTPIYELNIFSNAQHKEAMKEAVNRLLIKRALSKLKKLITTYFYRLQSFGYLNSHIAEYGVKKEVLFPIDVCLQNDGGSFDLVGCSKLAYKAANLVKVIELLPDYSHFIANNRRMLMCTFDRDIIVESQTLTGNIAAAIYVKQQHVNHCPTIGSMKPAVVEASEGWPEVKGQFRQLWMAVNHFITKYPHVKPFDLYNGKEIRDIIGSVQSTWKIAFDCNPKHFTSCNSLTKCCMKKNQKSICAKVVGDCMNA